MRRVKQSSAAVIAANPEPLTPLDDTGPQAQSATPIAPAAPMVSAELSASDREHHGPGVAAQMAIYDRVAGTPSSWPDIQTRAKVLRETVTAARERDDHRKALGQVVERAVMDAKLVHLRDYLFQFMEGISQEVSEQITEPIPVKLREKLIATIDRAVQASFERATGRTNDR